jgi:dTDP-4-dehydrorhamnose 3,5-epimerase-like enzyme
MIIYKLIQRPGLNKSEGSLCVAEANSESVPFDIKRVYYSYGVEAGIVRGRHAHKTLEQLLICVYGEIEVSMDNGKGEIENIILNDPSEGLYVGPSIWRTMKWLKSDSILLVLASHHYDPKDYIHDYDQFKSWVNKEGQ